MHEVASSGGCMIVDASHDGYRRLPGRNSHRRCWTLSEGSLQVEDHVSGTFDTAVACLHVHPDIEATLSQPREVTLSGHAGMEIRMHFDGAATIDLVGGTWHPRFGASISNQCIVVRLAGSRLITKVLWNAGREAA